MSDRKTVVDLLEKLSCYLVGDITSMLQAQPIGNCGGCGYPLLQTIISGSELCGRLELGLIKESSGEKAFEYFIKTYLPKMYNSISLLYGVFRNTPAHTFVTSVNIYKGGDRHMIVREGILEINIVEFANDFITGFLKYKTKMLSLEGTEFEKYFKSTNKFQAKLKGEAKQISTALNKDPEIQKRNYHYKLFSELNFSSVAASGIINTTWAPSSGASTMTEEQTKRLKDFEEIKK